MSLPDPPYCATGPEGVVLTLHIQPRASRNEVCGIQDSALKVRLTSPPVEGAANKLCREFLAELFNVSKSSVEIISGETSRHKRVRISGSPQQLRETAKRLATPHGRGADQ